MKTSFARLFRSFLVAGLLALGAAPSTSLHGQILTNTTVTLVASDAQASEAGPDIGVFTVRRTGSTDMQLWVFLSYGGSAMRGVDFEPVPTSVVIPPGSREATITITPIDDSLIENPETVMARLAPSPLASPMEQYIVGTISNAIVTIADNDRPIETNKPPVVQIVSPTNDATFPLGEDIQLIAQGTDFDGYVATVEFFAGTNSLGVTTNNPLVMSPVNPFQLVWAKAPAGIHTLRALATDDKGALAWSEPVRIVVGDRFVPTVVNLYATDAQATEIPEVPIGQERPQLFDPGLFTVTRAGNTNIDLEVRYRLSGSASNGVDYARLTGSVVIPAGATSATLEVGPIDDWIFEGPETVTAALEILPCIAIYPPPPECYQLGPATHATVVIRDDETKETNTAPNVRITSPLNGARFPALADIPMRAVTVDPDGYANTVEFFAGAHKIGEVTIHFIQAPPPGQPIDFEFVWQDVAAGSYSLTARTVDNQGNPGVSAPVWIVVGETNRPPPTNTLVSIVARDSLASEGTNSWGGTATFLVSRSGPTNDSLTVGYLIFGTASNGVDYETLSGEVAIPAGHRSAPIVVRPIDDTLVERAETVVLSLKPAAANSDGTSSMNFGFSPKAAAIIADNDWVRPPYVCLPDRLFHLCHPGTNGQWVRIEASTNMLHWIPLCTNVVTDGVVHYVDPDAGAFPTRFYRVLDEANAATVE